MGENWLWFVWTVGEFPLKTVKHFRWSAIIQIFPVHSNLYEKTCFDKVINTQITQKKFAKNSFFYPVTSLPPNNSPKIRNCIFQEVNCVHLLKKIVWSFFVIELFQGSFNSQLFSLHSLAFNLKKKSCVFYFKQNSLIFFLIFIRIFTYKREEFILLLRNGKETKILKKINLNSKINWLWKQKVF